MKYMNNNIKYIKEKVNLNKENNTTKFNNENKQEKYNIYMSYNKKENDYFIGKTNAQNIDKYNINKNKEINNESKKEKKKNIIKKKIQMKYYQKKN